MTDDFDLRRFLRVQAPIYDEAFQSLRKGTIAPENVDVLFPGLAAATADPVHRSCAITSLDEARAYLSCRVLGGRYRECAGALLPLFGSSASYLFGSANAKKLHASLTLFSEASPHEFLLETMFDVWFDGLLDDETMKQIRRCQCVD